MSSVETLNISPAPSASLPVMIGVCTYKNPCSLTYLCIAKASMLLTLNTAEKVFDLGLRCAISLRYSKLCLFFCKGKSGEESQTIFTSVAWTSKACFPPWEATNFHSTVSELPTLSLQISSKFLRLFSKTIWIFLRNEPSLSSMNPNVLLSLIVLTRPFKMTGVSSMSQGVVSSPCSMPGLPPRKVACYWPPNVVLSGGGAFKV